LFVFLHVQFVGLHHTFDLFDSLVSVENWFHDFVRIDLVDIFEGLGVSIQEVHPLHNT
jgi:hypothetical protein